MKSDCVFCQIAQGKREAYKIWEDDDYLAFLSTYPNTAGATVVIPKKHLSSDIFEQSDQEIVALLRATKRVANQLKGSLDDVGRVGLVFEGFDINHLHAKLYPLHGTKSVAWEQRESNVNKYFTQYEGYISSHKYHKASSKDLELMQKIITKDQ